VRLRDCEDAVIQMLDDLLPDSRFPYFSIGFSNRAFFDQ